jgi:hypothetical protein
VRIVRRLSNYIGRRNPVINRSHQIASGNPPIRQRHIRSLAGGQLRFVVGDTFFK